MGRPLAKDNCFTAIPDLPRRCAVSNAENFLSLLSVQVDSFAVCEIGQGHALAVQPNDAIVVNFDLGGRRAIQWGHERQELEPSSVAIAPRRLAKRLAGPGRLPRKLLRFTSAPQTTDCSGFQTAPIPEPLPLACATVSANLGLGLGLIDQLRLPLVPAEERRLRRCLSGCLRNAKLPIWVRRH